MPTQPHQKTIKHWDEPGHVHELTFSCYQRRPLLSTDPIRNELSISIERACVRHDVELLAFVYMPEHVHLLAFPNTSPSSISEFLFAVKRPYSFRVKKLLEANNPTLLKSLTIQERPGKTTIRFWQEGPGYDRNLYYSATLRKVIDYIHLNQVRRGLVERPQDWPWSSFNAYYGEPVHAQVTLPPITMLET